MVEMLAATALAAVLFVTVLLVVASLGRERRELAQRDRAEVPAELVDLLRWDLQNARTVRQDEGRMLLSGFGSLDPRSLDATVLAPVEVAYEVRELADRSWLIRRQTSADGDQEASAELVCADVSAVEVVAIEDADEEPNADESAPPPPATHSTTHGVGAEADDAGEPLAAQVVLRVLWTDENRPALERLIVRK